MSARDEALRAMSGVWSTTASKSYGLMLNAIPGDVLVRLAIERGALAKVEIVDEWAGSSEIIDPVTKHHVDGPLYRVVEP